jgi:hypothetical protein
MVNKKHLFDVLTSKNAIKWLITQARSLDNWLVLLALINWLYIWHLSSGPCGVAGPWYCSWTWYGTPNRIMASALCFRSRRKWLEIIGSLNSVHLLAAHFLLSSTDELKVNWMTDQGYEIGGIQGFLHGFVESPILQGCFVAAFVAYPLFRFLRRQSNGRLSAALNNIIRTLLLVLVLGLASNYVSHVNAERSVARWLYHDVLKGSALHVNSSCWDESAERFAGIGATVIKEDHTKLEETRLWAEVGPSIFTGPFLIEVFYRGQTSEGSLYGGDNCLVLNLFGYTKILDRNSLLWRQILKYLYPFQYLWPY